MSQSLLEMAKELVAELIRVHHLPPNDATALLLSTHATLRNLHQREAASLAGLDSPAAGATGTATLSDWKQSIGRHAIICLECGGAFRQLSTRHLRVHDLDPQAYRAKYGIPRTQPLSSRRATARRRELAQQIRPWEGAASKRSPRTRRS